MDATHTLRTLVMALAFALLGVGLPAATAEEPRLLFRFDAPAAARAWQTVNDGVMGGLSEGRFRLTGRQTMEFFGTLSLRNNGGFASVRSRPGDLRLQAGDTLAARVRGDGREYFWNLYVPGRRMAFSYRAPFQTVAGQWIEVSLPLRAFYATSFGRRVQNAPLKPRQVQSLGFLLADKRAGPFQLEVEWIEVRTAGTAGPPAAVDAAAAGTPQAARQLSVSHVTRTATPYYTSGPQQGRPPDGLFPGDTLVQWLEESGSHVRVRSADGVEAFVAADALREFNTPQPEVTMDVSEIVAGGNRFAINLYQQLRREQSGNLFFSPASISVALAMTSVGGRGETASEMVSTLQLPAADPTLHDRFAQLQSQWVAEEANSGVRLHLANRLWGRKGEAFLDDFLALTRTNYGAELAPLDFANQTEAARQTINTWVSDQTEQKITELLPSGVLDPDTMLVLTNAVYFHGLWSAPFDPQATVEDVFHVAADETVRVPLMHHRERFRYAAVAGVQVLELPYGSRQHAMVVLLPDKADGLLALEERLTAENLQAWTSQLRSTDVIVNLPRFQTTSQFVLNETLQSLGMVSAFDRSRADFSGINGERNLFLSAAVHKAFVEVHEAGTEAAAATGVVIGVTSVPDEPEQPTLFRADHPFLFLIRDQRSGAILFLGRVLQPES